MVKSFPVCQFELPDWICEVVKPGQILADEHQRIAAAVKLSRQQVERGTGGPFGAVVCNLDSGELVGAGVNRVVPAGLSVAHAEVVAWSVAQRYLDTFDLATSNLGLYSSAQPCIACWGGLFWSGIKRLVYAATKDEVEQLAGFEEGPVPANWQALLEASDISVAHLAMPEAGQVLADYHQQGGIIYNPS